MDIEDYATPGEGMSIIKTEELRELLRERSKMIADAKKLQSSYDQLSGYAKALRQENEQIGTQLLNVPHGTIEGLTRRDILAGFNIAGLQANIGANKRNQKWFVEMAYEYADAMMEAADAT